MSSQVLGTVGSRRGDEGSERIGWRNSRHEVKLRCTDQRHLPSALLSGALHTLVRNFRALLTFNGLGEYTFFFLTVLGAIILRFREPSLERPLQASPLSFRAYSQLSVDSSLFGMLLRCSRHLFSL